MEYAWLLYWVTRLDAAHSFLDFLMAFMTFTFIMSWIIYGIGLSDTIGELEVWSKRMHLRYTLIAPLVFVSVLSVFIPTKRDAILIAAGVGVVEAVKGIQTSTLVGKSAELLEAWIESELSELTEPKKTKGAK